MLRDVPELITEALIEQAIIDINQHAMISLKRKARIAVCALNPHCGELSERSEEKEIIQPSIEQLQKQGYHVNGPYSADALFSKARVTQEWDYILAMYHDQGLVAAKYPGVDKAINITLGLPFIRVSPAHGVAYDIVGQNKANATSMQMALKYASN